MYKRRRFRDFDSLVFDLLCRLLMSSSLFSYSLFFSPLIFSLKGCWRRQRHSLLWRQKIPMCNFIPFRSVQSWRSGRKRKKDVRQRRDFSAFGWRWSPIEREAVVFTRLWFENICCCFCDYFLKEKKQSVLCVYVLIRTLLISSAVFSHPSHQSWCEKRRRETEKRGEWILLQHIFSSSSLWVNSPNAKNTCIVGHINSPSFSLSSSCSPHFSHFQESDLHDKHFLLPFSFFSICMFRQGHVSLLYIPIDTIYFLCRNFNEILLSSSLTCRFADESSVLLTVILVFACFQVIVV